MEPMTLAELDTAPFRVTQSVTLPATPDAVFAELADPVRWTDWFPLMRRAEWTTETTATVGAERRVGMRVFGVFVERMLAWEPGKRFAFTMVGSSSPFVARMGEDWQLSREAGGTRLDWIVGAYPTLVGKPAAPVLAAVLRRMFRQGGGNLARMLKQRGTQVA
ncbi:MAG TPA: SRPBCC family protein [Kofleriaceae bacterium]|nr:SRPBCC family protein [Kofleriaceae bacterium]